MRADASSLLALLNGSKQFMIPTYQRTYSWTPKQCKQLREDILRIGNSDHYSNHFIGSILYISEETLALTGVTRISIIDGQQRLTTFSLLLHSLAKTLLEKLNKKREHDTIINNFIFNQDAEKNDRYKLYPTKIDRHAYISILEGYNLEEVDDSNIITNYSFFKDLINDNIDRINDVWKGIEKIYVVRISLNINQDNPQLIFESMNSTGLDLSKAELIKNYLLMGLKYEKQANLYNQYRLPMDKIINNNSTLYDSFFRDYLTFKSSSGIIPTMPLVYEKFKDFIVTGNESVEEVLEKIYRAFNNYMKFVGLREEKSSGLAEVLKDIRTLKATVAYPLMLELFEDYTQELLNEEHLITILKQIENYVFRRAIIGIPTNSMNKTFATFKRALNKTNSQSYFESFIAHLMNLDTYKIFPRDEQFKNYFVSKDIYNFRNNKYLLEKLENFQKKEKIFVDTYTIEHIMPQNTKNNEDWKRELGDDWKKIYETYLHTIGNITLTGYNPDYSDKSFQEKKNLPEKGFNYSPIGLNGMLRDIDHWSEETIKHRAHLLAEKATRVWEQIKLSKDILEKYITKEDKSEKIYTYNDLHYLEGKTIELFQELQKKILNIHPDIKEEIKALYIAFKYQTNFVDIEPQRGGLRMTLNANIEDIMDPKGICRDISGLGAWGNGNVSFHIRDESDIEYSIFLIKQSFEMQQE